jgi:hypothetical protein
MPRLMGKQLGLRAQGPAGRRRRCLGPAVIFPHGHGRHVRIIDAFDFAGNADVGDRNAGQGES